MILGLLFLLINFIGQSEYKETASIPIGGQKILLSDNLNNFYVLTESGLTKYSIFGKKISSFSDGSLGNITSADVTNPYKIITYFDNYNQIIYLDDALTVMAEPVRLDDYKLFSVRTVSYAPYDGFYMFDEDTYTIKHFSPSFKLDYESASLYSYLAKHTDSLNLFYRINRLFLFQPAVGMLIFDENGNYLMTVTIPHNPKNITIGKTELYYKNDKDEPEIFSFETGQSRLLNYTSTVPFQSFIIVRNYLIVAEDNAVKILKKV